LIDLCLKHCKLSPGSNECNIGIQESKIIVISKEQVIADNYLDLKGNLVLPGLIDTHVHLRDPGMTYKEDFRTGTMAAAAGGFTTVLDMPNTDPPTNTVSNFKEKMKIGRKKSMVDFGLHAGVSDLNEIRGLSKLSPASFKIFMDLYDPSFLLEAFQKINGVSRQGIITVHAEDPTITQQCTKNLKKETNRPEAYALARPPLAEEIAVGAAISLSEQFQQPVHFCHLSTPISLELVAQAKRSGIPVTNEVTPHHLFLDASYLKKYGTKAKTNPPLRDKTNKLKFENLKFVDIIGTDHAPHTIEEKENDIWNAPPGIPGLETILPLLLTQVNKGSLAWDDIKRLLCENPARIFNIKNKGHIKVGMDADLVVVDLQRKETIDPDKFYSKAHYTPFKDFKVQGIPTMTLVRGRIVMEEGEIFKNKGKCVYN
jgi:dihydroorotase